MSKTSYFLVSRQGYGLELLTPRVMQGSVEKFLDDFVGSEGTTLKAVPSAWDSVLETFEDMESTYPIFAEHILHAIEKDLYLYTEEVEGIRLYRDDQFVDCAKYLYHQLLQICVESKPWGHDDEKLEVRQKVEEYIEPFFERNGVMNEEDRNIYEYKNDGDFHGALVCIAKAIEIRISASYPMDDLSTSLEESQK